MSSPWLAAPCASQAMCILQEGAGEADVGWGGGGDKQGKLSTTKAGVFNRDNFLGQLFTAGGFF